MQILVLADEEMKSELLEPGTRVKADIKWIRTADEIHQFSDADALVDLLFMNDKMRLDLLSAFLPRPVLINSVVDTLQDTNVSFIRFNGWKTFLSSRITEAAGGEVQKQGAELVLSVFHKIPEWLPDEPGFFTPRVVSMMINEAYFAYTEGVGSKKDIDTAMKLGTNYPYGPFEWASLIGEKNITQLLNRMAKTDSRYQPAPSLVP